jgi:AraC-like DNA-binding protein
MELRPGYRELPVPEAVRDVVDCLWVRITGGADEVRVLPDGRADVVWRQGHRTTLVGPETRAQLISYSDTEVLVGIRFQPGAAGPVMGVPLQEVRDLRVDVVDVDPAFDVEADLAPADVLARFLEAAADRRGDPLVTEAVRLVAQHDVSVVARVLRFRRFLEAVDRGEADLASLALDAGYADQAHLTRETARLAGVTPLELVRSRRG